MLVRLLPSSHFSPSWRPGAAPACSSPCLGIGLNPASSGRDASAPTPRHLRAPSVPSAVLLSPHSPNLRRRSAKKSAQAVSGQPEPPMGVRAGQRPLPPSPPTHFRSHLAAPPSLPPRPRHIALPQPRPPAPHPDPPVAGPARARLRPSQKSPRRASRVFWKKLLLRARPPFRPIPTSGVCQTPPSVHHARSGHHYIRR